MNKKRVVVKKKVNKERTIKFVLSLSITGYLLSSLVGFITTEKFDYITASYGNINDQQFVQGVVTRHEKIVESPVDGYVKYLYIEGVKVPVEHPVVRIGDSEFREIYTDMISKANNELAMSQESLGTTRYDSNGYNTNTLIKNRVSRYMKGKDHQTNFQDVYRLESHVQDLMKDRYEAYIVENNRELEKVLMNKQGLEQELQSMNKSIISQEGGILSYYMDNYTDIQPEDITKSFIKDYDSVVEHISIESRNVKVEDPLFKMVTNQTWNITFYLDELWSYEKGNKAKIYIDEMPLYGKIIDQIKEGKQHKIVMELDEYMHHFIKDRVVTIKIGETNIEGIKLPKSSLIDKDLIGIPENMIKASQGVRGVIRRGSEGDSFYKVNSIYRKDQMNYVSAENSIIGLGDQLISTKLMPDGTVSPSTYTVQEQIKIPGAYVINKGFKEFRVVNVLFEADDYVIIEKDTPQGIELYDRVQINSESIDESEK